MKKILSLLFIFFIFTLGKANANWYTSGVNTSYSTSSRAACGCVGDGCACETTPHVTNCFNSNGGTTPLGDNSPGGDNFSAVSGTSPSPYNGDPNYHTDSTLGVALSGNASCFYWDGQSSTISNSLTSEGKDGVWISGASKTVTLTPSDTGGSGIGTTKWCEGASCDPSTGNVGTSITKSANYNNTIRYQTWDNSLNASTIGSFILKLDNTIPTVTHNYLYSNVWVNGLSKTITLSPSDTGGSGVSITKWCEGATCNPSTGNAGTSITKNANYDNTIRFQTWDISGNASSIGSFVLKLDNTAPSTSDLPDSFPSVNPANNSNLLASNNQLFTITPLDNGLSPIVKIQGFFENSGDCFDGFHSIITSNSSSISTSSATHNIKEVKPTCNFNAGGYREYSFKITYVEDSAGNSLGVLNAPSSNIGIKTYNYKVFSNSLAVNITTKSVTTDQVTSVNSNIADGLQKNIVVTLSDSFGNPIIPASFIGRNVNFTFDVNNSLYLDQSDNSGGSAVYMSIPSGSTNFLNTRFSGYGLQTQTFTNQPSSDGTYLFGYHVYSPTNYILTGNDFTINSINYSISRTTQIVTNDNPSDQLVSGSLLKFDFKPLYYLNFSGEIATSSGFVEGKTQSGTIVIDKYGTVSADSIDGVYFLQTGTKKDSFTGSGTINSSTSNIFGKVGIGTKFISVFNLSTNYVFKTLFTLVDYGGAYLDDIKYLQLNSYIKYVLDGKTVTYLAGILNNSNTQSVETLKIYGITNIDKAKQKDLVVNQDKKDIKNLAGEITKSSLRKDIIKNALNIVKFVQPNNGSNTINNLTGLSWSDNTDGKKLGNILYFGDLNGANVTLDNGNKDNLSTFKHEGKKTIVVRGGNLYIKSNVINKTSSDILGIIVMKDDANNGGKVYIDTNVQEIDAVIYADKSLISYTNFYGEVDGNIDNQSMQNQLYIYGTVFSENTIGGSRKSPPICPFWTKTVPGFVCDSVEAQKYDFNYLRAGKNNKYKSTYADYPIIIKYNSSVQSTPPPLFDN